MSLSNSRLAYEDCYGAMDKAMASTRGIRISFPARGLANHFRMRAHQARAIMRNENRKIYTDPDHPLHGRSDYDGLRLTIEEEGDVAYLYIRKSNLMPGEIEDLDEIEGEEVDTAPVVLSTDHEDIAEDDPEPALRRRL